jgi:LysR family transcriptional regulator, hydrogen peroxide-inducible genes activator
MPSPQGAANYPPSKEGRSARRRSATRPDFNQLETFLKVAETRSFAETARQLGVSQPAVSQVIARLEALYGGDLFVRRRGAPVSMTPIGRAILPTAKLLLFTVDQQIERALATAQSLSGCLAVGFHPGLAFGPLATAIADFHETRPDVQLRFVEASPGELHRQLNERTIDIAFSAFLPDLSNTPNTQERLWDEPLVVAFRDDHSLAGQAGVSWSDLSGISIILRSHQGDLMAYRAVAARMGDRPFDCTLHDVSRSALIELVRVGIGATIIFASAAVPREGITFVPIEDKLSTTAVEAIWATEDRNPLRHRLLTFVQKRLGSTRMTSVTPAAD